MANAVSIPSLICDAVFVARASHFVGADGAIGLGDVADAVVAGVIDVVVDGNGVVGEVAFEVARLLRSDLVRAMWHTRIMDDVYSDRLDALEQTWRVWAELGDGLTEDQWATVTRCPGWDGLRCTCITPLFHWI